MASIIAAGQHALGGGGGLCFFSPIFNIVSFLLFVVVACLDVQVYCTSVKHNKENERLRCFVLFVKSKF